MVSRKGKKEVREMEKEIKKRFEYVIKVNGKDVWYGQNPEEKFDETVAKNPGKKVSVAWRTYEKVLIC